MATYWTSSLNSFKAIRDFNWSVVPYPKKKAYATDSAGLHPLSIAKESKAQDAAWALVRYVAGTDGQMLLAREGGFTPIRKSLLAEAIKVMGMPQASLFVDYQKYGQLRLVAPGRPDIARIMTAELAGLWAGTEDARTAGIRTADKVNQFLKDNPQG
jgi:ABC-type glycerol-3-phosphate transport system substrate-binding protein